MEVMRPNWLATWSGVVGVVMSAVGVGLVVAGESADDRVAGLVFALMGVLIGRQLFMYARLLPHGISYRNFLARRLVPWDDISAVRVKRDILGLADSVVVVTGNRRVSLSATLRFRFKRDARRESFVAQLDARIQETRHK